jgi:hypothetical protein
MKSESEPDAERAKQIEFQQTSSRCNPVLPCGLPSRTGFRPPVDPQKRFEFLISSAAAKIKTSAIPILMIESQK